jgi:hypothetical protein
MDKIKELEAENKRLADELENTLYTNGSLQIKYRDIEKKLQAADSQIVKLEGFVSERRILIDQEEKLKVAVEALEIYANEANWLSGSGFTRDNELHAREALLKIKQGEGG